jgi:hypothetical protein
VVLVNVNPSSSYLQRVDVGCLADVSEKFSASILRVQVSKLKEGWCYPVALIMADCDQIPVCCSYWPVLDTIPSPRISVGPLVYIIRTLIYPAQFISEGGGSVLPRNIGKTDDFHLVKNPKSRTDMKF